MTDFTTSNGNTVIGNAFDKCGPGQWYYKFYGNTKNGNIFCGSVYHPDATLVDYFHDDVPNDNYDDGEFDIWCAAKYYEKEIDEAAAKADNDKMEALLRNAMNRYEIEKIDDTHFRIWFKWLLDEHNDVVELTVKNCGGLLTEYFEVVEHNWDSI